MPAARPKLVIFTRPIVPGLGKTRLIPHLGQHRVAELARAFLLDTYHGARALERAEVIVAVSEPGPLPLLTPAPEVWRQGSGDLGERLCRVARRALKHGTPWVILLGSDAPGLPPGYLVQAARALDDGHPAVLGPAEDGGYYLLGLRRCPEGLLANLPYSSPATLAETRARLAGHGMAAALLPSWFDVDEPGDLERLKREMLRGTVEAPATQKVVLLSRPS